MAMEHIRLIADAVSGNLDLASLDSLPDEGKIARLTTRSGVGIWTAEMLLVFLDETTRHREAGAILQSGGA